MSKKRAVQLRAYRRLREAFLDVRPVCEYPGCTAPSEVVHHKRGRRGLRLLDTAWWAASCAVHNEEAETETGHALEIGWLVRIEGVA